jgi:hypothetical protein
MPGNSGFSYGISFPRRNQPRTKDKDRSRSQSKIGFGKDSHIFVFRNPGIDGTTFQDPSAM